LNIGDVLLKHYGHTDNVNAVAFSPDGTRIASGSNDDDVRVWDATDGGNEYVYTGHTDGVRAVAFSPDGTRIASGSNDDETHVFLSGLSNFYVSGVVTIGGNAIENAKIFAITGAKVNYDFSGSDGTYIVNGLNPDKLYHIAAEYGNADTYHGKSFPFISPEEQDTKYSVEEFTSNHDTWVNLTYSNLVEGQQNVTETGDLSVVFEEDTDYEMDYVDGRIKVLSTGSMADATVYRIAYQYEQ